MEAFLNELVELGDLPAPDKEPLPPAVARLLTLLKQAENDKASTSLKFMLARTALLGEPYDTGALPYQDFVLLIALRNALVHYRPLDKFEMDAEGVMQWIPPRLLDKLRSRRILAPLEADLHASWLTAVSTPAVAAWACDVACQMVTSVIEAVPASALRRHLDFFYGKVFAPDEPSPHTAAV